MVLQRFTRNEQGQTILEMLIAIFVIVVGVFGILTLIISTIQAGREGSNRIVALNLAREGIENVRSIRDSNWVYPVSATKPTWDNGLNGGSTATPIVDTMSATTPVTLSFNHNWNEFSFTQIRAFGHQFLQGVATGETRTFFRLFDLNAICRNPSTGVDSLAATNTAGNDCTAPAEEVGIRVVSTVRWPTEVNGKQVMLEERLYNWGF